MRIYRDLLILISIFGIVWLGFSLWTEPISQNDFISTKQEEEIAETIEEYILNEFEISQDTSYNILFDSLENRLLNNLDSPIYDYSFTLLEGSEVNAFCAFSGKIYVFKGLINSCESPEELAAILSHEIGHGQERHVVKNLIKELGFTTLMVIISGGDPVILDQVVKTILSSSFSRQMEKEADDFAFKLLQKAHINPQNLTAFFIRLNARNSFSNYPEWISSHPSLENRIERLVGREKDDDFIEIPMDLVIPMNTDLEFEEEL